METQSETSSREEAATEKKETIMPKYTLRSIASYMLLNGILLFFIPQFYSFGHWGLSTLATVLGIFTLINVVAAVQIFRKNPQGLILGIIGLLPFCFSLSVKAFSYKLLTALNIILNLNYSDNGDFKVGLDFSLLGNSIDAYLNVADIGITINFVAVAALSFLVEAYLKQKESGLFPIQGY